MKYHVQVFKGIANKNHAYLTGRVYKGLFSNEPGLADKKFITFKRTLKRYLQKGVPDCKIVVHFQGKSYQVLTDMHGLFHLETPFDPELSTEIIAYEATNKLEDKNDVIAFMHPGTAIISDIDDTILISHSTRWRKKFKQTFLTNIKKRSPVENISRFYHSFHHNNHEPAPVFYVSSSIWNIYDYLEKWMYEYKMPGGPLLLRPRLMQDMMVFNRSADRHFYKYTNIDWIFQFFPYLNFVLVGDSGQHDIAIYSQISQQYADRIKGIYIRQVHERHQERLENAKNHFGYWHIPFFSFLNIEEAAYHAAEHQLLNWDAFVKSSD